VSVCVCIVTWPTQFTYGLHGFVLFTFFLPYLDSLSQTEHCVWCLILLYLDIMQNWSKPSHSTSNKMQCFSIYLFISVRRSTCFRRFFRPSSGIQNCLAGLAVCSSNGLTNTWRCMCGFELLMMDGKTRLKHVERLTEINILWNFASCWLYCANILAMHGPVNVELIKTLSEMKLRWI